MVHSALQKMLPELTNCFILQWQVVVGWSFSTIAALLIQFGMYSYNTIPAKAMYEIMTQVTYGGLQRSVWAACLAWIVFACHNGYGGTRVMGET